MIEHVQTFCYRPFLSHAAWVRVYMKATRASLTVHSYLQLSTLLGALTYPKLTNSSRYNNNYIMSI